MYPRSLSSIANLGAIAVFALAPVAMLGASQSLGIFSGQQDVGTVLHAGSAQYDNAHDVLLPSRCSALPSRSESSQASRTSAQCFMPVPRSTTMRTTRIR